VEIPLRRTVLVRSALIIMRAFVIAEAAPMNLPIFGRFETWSAVVREPLVWLGLPDPCESLRAIARVDPVTETLARLLIGWEACFGSKPTTLAQAVAISKSSGEDAAALVAAFEPFTERGEVNTRRLGGFLRKYAGRFVDGLSFDARGLVHKVQAWAGRHAE